MLNMDSGGGTNKKVSNGCSDQFPAGLRVLVVDDDPTCLKILEKMLRNCLYEVITCSRAVVALTMLRERTYSFDLVLSEVHMPDMDGFKLLEHIGLEMDLPVIMMSVDDKKEVVMKGVTHGACDYLIKPVRIEAIRNIWQHVVRKRRNELKELEQSGSYEDNDRNHKASENVDYASSVNDGSWKSSKKRKEDEDEMEDRDDTSTMKKSRVDSGGGTNKKVSNGDSDQFPTTYSKKSYVGKFAKNSTTDSITRLLSDLATEKPQLYSHAQLMKFTKEFSDPVGSGGFGDVYKGEFPNGVSIAVKVLKNSRPELMEKQFAAEVSTMGKTYHRNLIKLYGYCYEGDMKALIYEYMEKGALDVILKKNNLDMVKLFTIATELARGISYLHESCYPQIIHQDLKPAFVLINSKFSPRIIDFGLAKFNMEKSQFAQTGLRGTRGYVAPEMTQLELGMISCKCDVFSFGMMLFNILESKINAGHGWLPGQVGVKFQENKLDNFLKDIGIKEDDKAKAKTLSIVALLCAEYNPQSRPSMSTVVKILEGEMTPRLPVNPFPHYDPSSDNSSDSRN